MNQKLKINLLGLFTVLLWGASYPATKIAHEGFSSGSISFLRCIIAALILLALAIPRQQDHLIYDWLQQTEIQPEAIATVTEERRRFRIALCRTCNLLI